MIPYLLAVAGGYLIGNAFKHDATYAEGFAEGGMMAKGGWVMDNDGEKNVIDDSKYKEYIKRFKSSDSWKQTQDSPNVKVFESGTSKTKFTKIK